MLRKLRVFYYNNKEKIWFAVGIFALICIIIQIINYAVKRNSQERAAELVEGQNASTNRQYTPSTTTTIASDSKLSEATIKEDNDLIEQFMNYGNSNDVEGAYNLLSQDCKDEMFPSIDRFYENYFKDIFNEKKSYDVETWVEYNDNVTYRVKYLNDIMATGTINDEFIEDYFTVIEINGEKKLNINNFISKLKLDEKKEMSGLEVSIICKYDYYDYVEYEFTFKNNSDKQITIDTKNNTESVYIEDNNDVEYTWFGNEVPNEYLTLNSGDSRTFRIKFNKVYNPERLDESINFTDIRIDGEDEVANLRISV